MNGKNKKGISSNTLTKMIPLIFKNTKKHITINLLRHIYISEKFPPELEEEKQEIASLMGHSVDMQKVYSKKKD